eukprot:6191241-Pleurochrysis_carterae.AAC.8
MFVHSGSVCLLLLVTSLIFRLSVALAHSVTQIECSCPRDFAGIRRAARRVEPLHLVERVCTRLGADNLEGELVAPLAAPLGRAAARGQRARSRGEAQESAARACVRESTHGYPVQPGSREELTKC